MLQTYLIAILLCISCRASAQSASIIIPPFNDEYSHTVKKLEANLLDSVDYRAFRKSFLESEQFKIAWSRKTQFDSLEQEMYSAMHEERYPKVIAITKSMLSIDYTSMLAQKILQQTYRIIGDSLHQQQYHEIELGLLRSIVDHGNGKTCETAWPVIQTAEEYFILSMLDAKLKSQSLDNTGGLCDKMVTETDEGEKTYYFEVSDAFHGYNNLGIK